MKKDLNMGVGILLFWLKNIGFPKIFYYRSYRLIAGGMEDYKSYIIVERVPNFSLPMFIMT